MGRPAWAPSVRWGRQASKSGNPESCNSTKKIQRDKDYERLRSSRTPPKSQIFKKKLIIVNATFEIHLILEAGPGADGRQLKHFSFISLIQNASIKSFSSFQPGIRQVKAHIVLSLYSHNFQRISAILPLTWSQLLWSTWINHLLRQSSTLGHDDANILVRWDERWCTRSLSMLVHPKKLFKQAPNLVNTSTDSLIYKTMVLVINVRISFALMAGSKWRSEGLALSCYKYMICLAIANLKSGKQRQRRIQHRRTVYTIHIY